MKKKTLKDLSHEDIGTLAKHYAYSPLRYSAKYLAEKYNVSVSTFRRALEKAVVEAIVDEATVYRMRNKASQNAYLHYGEPGRINSIRYYDDLMEKRRNYLHSLKPNFIQEKMHF